MKGFVRCVEKREDVRGGFGCFAVAPYAGAWIEICDFAPRLTGIMSLPTRERGVKYSNQDIRQEAGHGRKRERIKRGGCGW